MKRQNIVIIVLVFVILLGGVFVYVFSNKQEIPTTTNPIVVHTTPTTTPVVEAGIQKIDEHLTINNELRDVNFCGKTYKVKQVLIDGVDVVQRVAEFAKNPDSSSKSLKEFSASICSSVPFNQQEIIEIENVMPFVRDKTDKKTATYGIFAQFLHLAVNPEKNEIYKINDSDSSSEMIGKL